MFAIYDVSTSSCSAFIMLMCSSSAPFSMCGFYFAFFASLAHFLFLSAFSFLFHFSSTCSFVHFLLHVFFMHITLVSFSTTCSTVPGTHPSPIVVAVCFLLHRVCFLPNFLPSLSSAPPGPPCDSFVNHPLCFFSFLAFLSLSNSCIEFLTTVLVPSSSSSMTTTLSLLLL